MGAVDRAAGTNLSGPAGAATGAIDRVAGGANRPWAGPGRRPAARAAPLRHRRPARQRPAAARPAPAPRSAPRPPANPAPPAPKPPPAAPKPPPASPAPRRLSPGAPARPGASTPRRRPASCPPVRPPAAGRPESTGAFFNLTYDGYWWTATTGSDPSYARYHYVDFNSGFVLNNEDYKVDGVSVRCVTD